MQRSKRLKKLVGLQEQLKGVHEARRAGHLADAAAAECEAADIAERFDDPDSLSALFPEVYHRRASQAGEQSRRGRELAEGEARNVALAKARMNVVERAYREAMREEEREAGDKERLEIVGRARNAREDGGK